MVGKPRQGSTVRGSLIHSAAAVSRWEDAAQDYARRRLGDQAPRQLHGVNGLTVDIRNDSTYALQAGHAVQIGALLTSAGIRFNEMWFSAALRAAGEGTRGILLDHLPDGSSGLAQVSGACMALVDVLDADHTHCYAKTSDKNPQSNFGGPWRILYKPSGTGDAKECVVVLGDGCYERKAVTDATLTAGSSAACSFLINGSDLGSETVYFNHMENGVTSVASGRDILVRWFDDEQKWCLVAAECP